MNEIKTYHRLAMEQSDFAIFAKMNGDLGSATEHLLSAFEFEAKAANLLFTDFDAEPSRSVCTVAPRHSL